jgi:hypothetical protein
MSPPSSTPGRRGRRDGRKAGCPTTCRWPIPTTSRKTRPRDVFVYFIHEGKIRAPQAAQALMERVD